MAAQHAVLPNLDTAAQDAQIKGLAKMVNDLSDCIDGLHDALDRAAQYPDPWELSVYYRDYVFTAMQKLRAVADEMELHVAAAFWPLPTYGEILFSV